MIVMFTRSTYISKSIGRCRGKKKKKKKKFCVCGEVRKEVNEV